MDVNEIVRRFGRYINVSWPVVESLIKIKAHDPLEFQEAIDDWLQANWEMLVEFIICSTPDQSLEVYGNGADCNGSSSRVWLPEASPTHRVVCEGCSSEKTKEVISGKLIIPNEYQFDGFVFCENGQYAVGPPFDHILLSNFSDIFIVRVEDIRFSLEEIVE